MAELAKALCVYVCVSIRTTVMLGFSFLQGFNVCSACFFMGYERDVHSALLCTRALCIVNMEKTLIFCFCLKTPQTNYIEAETRDGKPLLAVL